MRPRLLGAWCLVAALTTVSVGGAADPRLIEAARSRDTDAVRALLKQGADVNAPQPDGATALHWAAYWDDPIIAELLIRARADVNATNELGTTPLWLASSQGSAAMVAKLLNAGANPNVALVEGETPLMAASRAGSVAAVKSLLARGADVNAKERSRGQTALMWAVVQQHSQVVQALLEFNADVRARSNVRRRPVNTGRVATGAHVNEAPGIIDEDQGGLTPLLFAARQGALACGALLLAAGANVNETAPNGVSALVLAAHSGRGALAAFLLEHGADPNAAGAGYTALHAAVLRSDLDLIETLLAYGANPNAPLLKGTSRSRSPLDWALNHGSVGGTPFWLAAQFADADALRILAASGADRHVTLKNGTTALMAAISGNRGARAVMVGVEPDEVRAIDERNSLQTVQLLVEPGADINATDASGNTALHHAAIKGYDMIVQSLVDSGANLNTKNNRGQTPLAAVLAYKPAQAFLASDPRLTKTATLLRRLGALE